ncbi:hypothetical protein C7B80_25120 [Cyanosarcina cf. burmensis CCALA 770]|nr:hypothetical protein C7B80_25120 [Cyanosarcina cf. burmensis CCALA 770]
MYKSKRVNRSVYSSELTGRASISQDLSERDKKLQRERQKQFFTVLGYLNYFLQFIFKLTWITVLLFWRFFWTIVRIILTVLLIVLLSVK